MLTRVFGARLAQVTSDRLPTETTDARLVDADADGAPGVTFNISGLVNGRIHVVTRDQVALTGTVHTTEDTVTIAGDLRLERERVTLTATNPLLAKSPSSRPHPDPTKSYFIMVPLLKGQASRYVLKNRNSLFKTNVQH